MARLVVNPTSSTRRELPLGRNGLISIGRDPSNDLVLPDALVSRRHAVIECRGAQFYFRDCNSSNGSLVNGDRVSERPLRDGDVVSIGTARIVFREDDHEEAGAKVVQHPSAPKLHCAGCGADFRKGDQFCRHCGHLVGPAAPPRAVCTACGTSVPLPARFCNACGQPLSGAPAAAEAPAAPPPGPGADPAKHSGDLHTTEAMPVMKDVDGAPDPDPASRSGGSSARTSAGVPLARSVQPAGGTRQSAAAPAVPSAPPPAPRASTSRPVPFDTAARARAALRPRPETPEPVGFGVRLVAGLVDAAIVTTGQLILLAPVVYYWSTRELEATPADVAFLPIVLSFGLIPVVVAVSGVYYVYFWGVRGATPGQAVMGLAVEAEDGTTPIGVSRAAVRALGYLASGVLLGAGFLMIAFGGTGLHDRMAGTRVVRRDEGT